MFLEGGLDSPRFWPGSGIAGPVSGNYPHSSRLVAIIVEIWLPDQISGPPMWWRPIIVRSVALLRAMMDGHTESHGVGFIMVRSEILGPVLEAN